MAVASPRLVAALRDAALRIERGAAYEWGNMGRCNCGHLAQSLTDCTPAQIHAMAMERMGDWTEQSREYCPTSGFQLDMVITLMLEAGLNREDIAHLEKVSDPTVLDRLPAGERHLARNHRDHAVLYMRTWAAMLEEQLAPEVALAGTVASGFEPKSQPQPVVTEALVHQA